MTRQRHVYPTDRIAHLWYHSHASVGNARNAGDNFYFSGDTIYSYGSHFPIARRLDCGAVLYTSRTYSATTSKHLSLVRRAIPDSCEVFVVENPLLSPSSLWAEFSARVDSARKALKLAKGERATVKAYDSLVDAISLANNFAIYFKRRERFKLPKNWEELSRLSENYSQRMELRRLEREKKSNAKYEQLRREREALSALNNAEKMEAWRAGRISNHYLPWDMPTMLRIVGETVETSRGAEIPLSHAVRACKALLPLLRAGLPYERQAHISTVHVGHFSIDSLSSDGELKAGCHRINREELELFVSQLEEMERGAVENAQ